MMRDLQTIAPESTAARVALWRALHVAVDAAPHAFRDEIGLQLLSPNENWRDRPDMDPQRAGRFRVSIVARSRFIEDLVIECAEHGVRQYVILGAGLDTFAQRRPDIASRMTVYEVDQPGPQVWKRGRLIELGFGVPDWLRFVPVDFESGGSWWEALSSAGFERSEPAVIACAGVSVYLTREANIEMLRHTASLGAGSTFAMTFAPPIETLPPQERAILETAANGARASGTPVLSFFTPAEIVALAKDAGFNEAHHVPGTALIERYFGERPDDLRSENAEEFLIALTTTRTASSSASGAGP
jgi:methyltransferase (TIGR00027 family)